MATPIERLIGRTTVPVLLPGALLAPPGGGTDEPLVPLQLSFSTPGAGSMGFGGAFAGPRMEASP